MLFHRETESERLDKLKTLLVLSKISYAHMNRVNDYFRKHGTTLGCLGVEPDMAKSIDDGIKSGDREFADGLPFSNHTVKNEYYGIQQLKREIAELESRMDKFTGWAFPGGEAIVNTEENRLQLRFDGEIGMMKRIVLRQRGFSWSIFHIVWERRLSREAIRAAAHIRFVCPDDGISPEQLQPYARKSRTCCVQEG